MSSKKRKLEHEHQSSHKRRRTISPSSNDNTNETEDERRKRLLLKKQQKEYSQKMKEKELYFGYSNDNNPYNDSSLTELFVWNKKFEEQGYSNAQIKKVVNKRLKRDQKMRHSDILATKERRRQREIELEAQERLKEEIEKEMQLEENAGWQEKEDQFHEQNAIKKSQIRLNDGREKSIDILVRILYNFNVSGPMKSKEISNPIQEINGLELFQLANLLTDISVFIEMYEPLIIENEIDDELKLRIDKKLALEYWNNARLYTLHIYNIKNSDQSSMMSTDVLLYNEMRKEFESKTYDEVCAFYDDCQFMAKGKPEMTSQKLENISVDVDYWEKCSNIVTIIKAEKYLDLKYFQLLEMRKIEHLCLQNKLERNAIAMNASNNSSKISAIDAQMCFTTDVSNIPQFPIPQLLEQTTIADKDISEIIDESHPNFKLFVNKAIDAEQDLLDLEMQRFKVLKQSMKKIQMQTNTTTTVNNSVSKELKSDASVIDHRNISMLAAQNANRVIMSGAEMCAMESHKPMEDGYMSFNKSEITVPVSVQTTYWWHDKYRARKPRYFNRVRTGYSWNKYNQTHYDPDNPPPKIVQGYKFNIFYPDLIDNTNTPNYKLYEKIGEEYATLVFHAGPPYEDIAFKIVNNEWEPSHRRGFRCRFEKGIFCLYFNFKRYRYRR